MKRKPLIAFIVFLVAVSATYLLAQAWVPKPHDTGQELFTAKSEWKLLRAPGAMDGTAITNLTNTDLSFYTKVAGSTRNPADILTNINATTGMIDLWAELGWGVNAVEIALFTVDDLDGDTLDLELYGWADSTYAPAQPIYITTGGGCIVGTYDCVKHPTLGTTQAGGLWIDTISGTDCWPAGVTVSDSGNNRFCTLTVDVRGCRYLWLRCYGASAANVGAIVRKY